MQFAFSSAYIGGFNRRSQFHLRESAQSAVPNAVRSCYQRPQRSSAAEKLLAVPSVCICVHLWFQTQFAVVISVLSVHLRQKSFSPFHPCPSVFICGSKRSSQL
jgi:hypothetical protein